MVQVAQNGSDSFLSENDPTRKLLMEITFCKLTAHSIQQRRIHLSAAHFKRTSRVPANRRTASLPTTNMEIDLPFLPHWPPPNPISITAGLIAILTFIFYSLILGVFSILGSFILCLPICGFYLLLGRWKSRSEDEEGGSFGRIAMATAAMTTAIMMAKSTSGY
jgi:hypothetical protein